MRIKLEKPYYQIIDPIKGKNILKKIEKIGRVCYKSEKRITIDSYKKFVRKIIDSGHESVIEHTSFTVFFYFDRGISHELVRHRIASYSQESTRYVAYKNEISYIIPQELRIIPCVLDTILDIKSEAVTNNYDHEQKIWLYSLYSSTESYLDMINLGKSPQIARGLLPHSLKTELFITANLREWRHILRERTSSGAHPQMKEIMIPLLQELNKKIPIIFEDIYGRVFNK